jgi:vacuolar protein 8
MSVDENRHQLVHAGAIPVLVGLLNSPDTDVQYYCTTALSNIAVDGESDARADIQLVADTEAMSLRCQPEKARLDRAQARPELGRPDGQP